MYKIYTDDIANEIVAKMATVQIGDVDVKNGTFEVVITSDAMDRQGEILLPEGMKYDNYMKNPIVLFGHDQWEIESIVGKCTNLELVDNKWIAKGVFVGEDVNPKAQMLRKMYDQGFIRTTSVGLKPLIRDTTNRNIIREWELLEFSFVPVPANPEALRLSKEIGAEWIVEGGGKEDEEKNDVKALREEVKSLHTKMDDILSHLTKLADGKAIDSDKLEKKEQIQSAVRTLNEVLRDFKR